VSLSPITARRISAAFIALVLGQAFVWSPIRQVWRDHWLVKDGQEGTAMITGEHWAGHGVVVYEYRVGQMVYTGQDHRSSQDTRYALVMPGEKSVVYYSASHPWLSAINPPVGVFITGLPVVLLAWFLEVGLLITVVNPKSRWALRFDGQRRPYAAQPPTQFNGSLFKDRMRLFGYGILIVLAMGAVAIGLNALFGRK
jgi:hypothetical protein